MVEGVHAHPSHRAVVGERYKLIHEPDGRVGPDFVRDPAQGKAHPSSLYDLREDPAERRDLLADEVRPPEIEATRLELMQALDAVARTPRKSAPVTKIDPAMAERLRALGYLGEELPAGEEPDAPPRDED
jgi:hypothetical protein